MTDGSLEDISKLNSASFGKRKQQLVSRTVVACRPPTNFEDSKAELEFATETFFGKSPSDDLPILDFAASFSQHA